MPVTLGDALDRLEQDEVIRSSLPHEMYDVYMHYKRTSGSGSGNGDRLGSGDLLGLSAIVFCP